jgi:signal transduction histidine kinase
MIAGPSTAALAHASAAGCETAGMIEEPVPQPSRASGPADGFGSAPMRRWFAPVADPASWAALGYLVVSLLWTTVGLVLAIVLLGVALPLVLVVVGIPLTLAALATLRRVTTLDRRLAGWVGAPVGARRPPAPAGPGSAWSALGDGERWRAAGWYLSAPVVFVFLTAGALAAWAVPLHLLSLPLWGWAVGMGPVALVAAFVVGVAALGLAPRLVLLLGSGGARFAEAVLGPDRAEVMAARIDALTRQREEIVAAVAVERRRIERNLHDGVQQRLVALGIDLGMAAGRIHTDPDGAAALVAAAREQTRTAIGELRVLGRGLHPAILDDRGLDAALSAVVASSSVPLQLSVEPGIEVPIAVAETAYFVVNEAVTNTMKHADARSGSIRVAQRGDTLEIEVHDDGRGGADPGRGTGLAGMRARVQGADGSLIVTSPRGGPTIVRAQLPLPAAVPRPSATGTGPVTGRSR